LNNLPKRAARRCLRLFSHRLPQRARNDYATHVPVLVGLGHLLRIRRVLEFGCGLYSTLTFLNRSVFPELIQLDSLESDTTWLKKIEIAACSDPRLHLLHVLEPMEDSLKGICLDSYDLVFVDSSTECSRRSATIRALAAQTKGAGFVIMHDFEVDAYRRAARDFSKRFDFPAFNPSTGVGWNTDLNVYGALKTVRAVTDAYANRLPPGDVDSWSLAFQQATLGFRQPRERMDINICRGML
jgi:hypothetical protein